MMTYFLRSHPFHVVFSVCFVIVLVNANDDDDDGFRRQVVGRGA